MLSILLQGQVSMCHHQDQVILQSTTC
ncbi:hypothetical protein F383_03826 [Gossypium arboreum]|uniref:Uncharacterized protein n=1 Tax=Gossypium arboreum TaxID=29729 RepID=A0A0B0P8Y6_GOSAR|nr:hypothetical protein F383_03826 [Gossypium arboreum]